MPNYSNGKIYKLIINNSDQIYIGSTVQTLSQRLSGHKTGANTYVSKKLFELQDDEFKVKIILIKNFPCNNKTELVQEEDKFIQNTECINKCRAYTTDEEKKERDKEFAKSYREANKEILNEKWKIYSEANKEQINEQRKLYRGKNKEEINKKQKIYWGINKEEINKKQKINYQ